MSTPNKAAIADLVAKYGSSTATAWLEFERYKLWSPSKPVPESHFLPIQGYMEKHPYIFAWGNPLVSSPDALPSVVRQFIDFAESQGKRLVWACVDHELEAVLGNEEFGWSTVSCIYEDVVDPAHVIELTSPEAKGQEGQGVVKDLKKNLYRADKYGVSVHEVKPGQWTESDQKGVEEGIADWKASKSGLQIASTTLQPWLDKEHRRYWLAKKDDKVVGILILTPVQSTSWQIKNAVSFPSAPKGTSEALIYTALKDLHTEQEESMRTGKAIPHPTTTMGNGNGVAQNRFANSTQSPSASSGFETSSTAVQPSYSHASSDIDSSSAAISYSSDDESAASRHDSDKGVSSKHDRRLPMTEFRNANRVTVTFGISASPELEPVHNVGGWKMSALSKTYHKVAKGAKLLQRGEFRAKFDSSKEPMYVCYPADGFGLDGVNALLKVLRK